MTIALASLIWLVGLGVALYCSEKLVHYLSSIGDAVDMAPGLLGLLVAAGADAPEVTSALIAVASGSTAIGLGVVIGSNIYNLAGLLGLTVLVVGGIRTERRLVFREGSVNVVLTMLLVVLLEAPRLHLPVGILLLAVLFGYAALLVGPFRGQTGSEATVQSEPHSVSLRPLILLSLVSAVGIVVGSDILVRSSIYLGPRLGIPSSVMGTFVLAIATSLPNTWAAISLGRRGLTPAALSATFNSNSINAAVGAGLPALFVSVRASSAARTIDPIWLFVMTAASIVFATSGRSMTRVEGAALVILYAAFVVVRLTFFA